MMFPTNVDVLIAGAGPAGLTLGSDLARRNISHLIVDGQAAGANTSRACVVHARTLEVLEPLEIVPELLARGIQVPIFRVRDRDRALLTVDFRNLPSRYAYTLMCAQSETEAILLAGLNARGGNVLRPCLLTSAKNTPDGAEATVRDPSGGEHVIRARYVVGCDGMHSTVREQAGIAFQGGSYEEVFVLADVHMDWPLSLEEVTLLYSPAGLVVVAPIPQQRFRIVATVQESPATPTVADVQSLLDARGPVTNPARVRDIVWSSRFHIHHRVAKAFRKGHLLVAGDAAHVHSPAGGQGMNTGIQDAMSLGSAFAATLETGNEEALDEWATRRQRIAKKVVSLTDRMTRAATIESRTGQAIRNAVVQLIGHVPAARKALAMTLSELKERAA
ncbi:MAG TPA: FAD-dependent monooxygenase [Steroidobacteraceae bacterium]|jgi:2-polyprenyl-6-methoxyphenol hydroxylase-like FAD-dependent oxidoreductase